MAIRETLRDDDLAAVQPHDGIGVLPTDVDDLSGDRQSCTELVGLQDGTVCQLAPRHASGEAEIVFDPHAATRLPPRRGALQQHRSQSLGGSVDRRGQPSRAGAHDDEIIDRPIQRLMDADRIGQLAG